MEKVLVTGGTGFVGAEAIVQLLQQGYAVKTTIRALNRKDEVLNMLKEAGITDFAHLEFVEADLLSPNNWDEAVAGCDYVLHVASPITLDVPKDENEFIKPAVAGVLHVLEAAEKAGVKRVVLTSNFGAIGYSVKDKNRIITEEDWTDPNERGLSAYNKSKVLAEKAAWDFMKAAPRKTELTVINPVGIFGPSYTPKLSSGFALVKQVLDGRMKAIPNLTLNIVDVRDLVDLHIRAMKHPKAAGERFLALSDGKISLPEIAQLYKEKYGAKFPNISSTILVDWVVKIGAFFSPKAKALAPMLGKVRNTTNAKAREMLGWDPRTKEEALYATADTLLKYNF